MEGNKDNKITYLNLSPVWPLRAPGGNVSEYKWLIKRNGDGLGGKAEMEGEVGNSEGRAWDLHQEVDPENRGGVGGGAPAGWLQQT